MDEHAATPPRVIEQLRRDGISFPVVSVRLRKWSDRRGDVRHVVISHTGKRYTVAVLIDDASVERSDEAIAGVRSALLTVPSFTPEVYVVGPTHADAAMFKRVGAYSVVRSDPQADFTPSAAA
jgi:hypothetical protein